MSTSPEPIEAVSQRLDKFVSEQISYASTLGSEAEKMARAGASSLRGGKRLRARFLLTGRRAVDEVTVGSPTAPDTAAVGVAAALEVFQAAALVHDDLIDNSDTRRGQPAAHRALQTAHRDARWAGDSEAFGRSAAILLGDLLVAWSDDLLEESLEGLATAGPTRRQYADMRRDVTIGQFLDVAEESAYAVHPDDVHADRALRVASYKSARYSIQKPLQIGAALAGADAAQLDALGRFGHDIGMAFQLRDDVLGVFGDSAVTGKPSGDDLREGKRTVLVAFARRALPDERRAALDALLGDRTLDAERIRDVQQTIVDTGALARTEELIAEYERQAENALEGARLGAGAVAELRELARAATRRSS
ncbi:MAG: geranylgeranyl pyrophosphate synthase [Microbacterium sp. 71-36]|uniref:polyprenyl synthetase family protein n=1 Tax=unclassified Microbacterium TaxID=2609290 RepID=UPI00086D5B09|nr:MULTISPECIES: polyprenyl synthetase family protein [unclassified Microbacterium]MBN9212265.1 polyprenyl synthetase family protein [Microbacterium sp.]ODT37323.1 MAG: geranylgeranyl pyrophosphate synthase [Microbacterium sp. SCN 71-17]ODU48640.1 MAG: geranylgeranyl pyrophosphate synthase [Microbacterium sp. SCN 70-10]OJV75705.1 MAG: geranylgeranyl pyrophosphate synthase [Microbacterium sp. 71-36]